MTSFVSWNEWVFLHDHRHIGWHVNDFECKSKRLPFSTHLITSMFLNSDVKKLSKGLNVCCITSYSVHCVQIKSGPQNIFCCKLTKNLLDLSEISDTWTKNSNKNWRISLEKLSTMSVRLTFKIHRWNIKFSNTAASFMVRSIFFSSLFKTETD